MSWMQKPQDPAILPPATTSQPYTPQQFGNQQAMHSNYQSGTPLNHQQIWQTSHQQRPPQQAHQNNQQFTQYQQSHFSNNANQQYQPLQYNQNFNNQGYSDSQQAYQQNLYQHQNLQQQNFQTDKTKSDVWEDNWDWGWEDMSKQSYIGNNRAKTQETHSQQAIHNANVLEESFSSTDNWHWSPHGKKDRSESIPRQLPPTLENKEIVNVIPHNNESSIIPPSNNEVKSLNDKEVIKEQLPNLALGKRFHLDNLTPQWSIESQMSQESSDGIPTQSESTHRSEPQSRNSNKSSPGLNTEISNLNFSQSGLDGSSTHNIEWSQLPGQDGKLEPNSTSKSCVLDHSCEEISHSLKEISLSNKEVSSLEIKSSHFEHNKLHDDVHDVKNFRPVLPQSSGTLTSVSSNSENLPLSSTIIMSHSTSSSLNTTSSANVSPPPLSGNLVATASVSNLPPHTVNAHPPIQNPFKHAGSFSHKNTVKSQVPVLASNQISNVNILTPVASNKTPQHNRTTLVFGANLETAPDNSERPDQPQNVSGYMSMSVAQEPDNLEVAPQNDRNQYLQTAHLSSADYDENTNFSHNVPPPGLRRMVVGQHESECNPNLNISVDEPPPGFARMVPGQQTETNIIYSQSNENFMDRLIDGQPMDGGRHLYRHADGQQTPDTYVQAPTSRGNDRIPISLSRMVPGESGNSEYPQFQNSNYSVNNDERVVTGLDHEFSVSTDPADVREQNVDGSDYSEKVSRNPSRNLVGAREVSNDASATGQQREVIMEGENLQDFSNISSTEVSFSREHILEGAINIIDTVADKNKTLSESVEHKEHDSRRQSLKTSGILSSGEDSERNRSFKMSPRRNKHKSSRDHDRDDRYLIDDRKYERDKDRRIKDDRHLDKDRKDKGRDKRDRDFSPDRQRHRRSTRHRYETEDTDYYSDREKHKGRSYREGSYPSSKPPRLEDREKRERERERPRRFNTTEREREGGRDREEGRSRASRSRRERDPHEYHRYRDIDPTRKRQEWDDGRKRAVTFSGDGDLSVVKEGDAYSSGSRAGSREGLPTDEELPERERRADRGSRQTRSRHARDPYYDGYNGSGYLDPYEVQRQQYQYYEHLRLNNPTAYMQVYKQLMAAQPLPPPQHHYLQKIYSGGFAPLDISGREERGSLHSGRSSTNGLQRADTYYEVARHERDAASLRDAPSLRTDFSDREFNTDVSLGLNLEESTVRSERMTPCKFSTAHIKGSISSRDIVVVRPSYPVDGLPATVHILSMSSALSNSPFAQEFSQYPGPLISGVTHKKSVIEYCRWHVLNAETRARACARQDTIGYALLWELLALLLRQNGVVVGADIAELLMNNTKEYKYNASTLNKESSSGRQSHSSPSVESREESQVQQEQPPPTTIPPVTTSDREDSSASGVEEKVAVDKLREYLIYGNRQEALDWAMNNGLWGHALHLSAYCDRRTRGTVTARFLAALAPADPLHTLYNTLAAKRPPAATCAADEAWGDWRPHAAIILSNTSSKPEQDRQTLTQLGDSLSARGLLYSAQFCYLSAGVPISRHPLAPLSAATGAGTAPPRLALLCADSRADRLPQLALDLAIFATEIYEYALSLNHQEYIIPELQVYKLILATRLVDCGMYERALMYTERVARAVTHQPQLYSRELLNAIVRLAERLKYHDPALYEESVVDDSGGGESGSPEASPRHQQWLHDLEALSQAANSQVSSPLHQQHHTQEQYHSEQQDQQNHQQYEWSQGQQQSMEQQTTSHVPTYPALTVDTPDYTGYYQQTGPAVQDTKQVEQDGNSRQQYTAYGDQWQRIEDTQQQFYGDGSYWQEQTYPGYGESGVPGGATDAGEDPSPTITMPGSSSGKSALYDEPPQDQQANAENETPKAPLIKKEDSTSKEKGGKGEMKSKSGGGWFGGIFTKLSLRPPNQMILPDDKNPTIVWDASRKRWCNTEVDEDDAQAPPPPPPTLADLRLGPQHTSSPLQSPAAVSAAQSQAAPPPPPAPPTSNIFKMQKGRHIKNSYVDVFNPSGSATRPLPPASEVLGDNTATVHTNANYFVPPPISHQGGHYNPSQSVADEDNNYNSGI